jgi:hypothetical protein
MKNRRRRTGDGTCPGCGEHPFLMPLHGDKGGPLRCPLSGPSTGPIEAIAEKGRRSRADHGEKEGGKADCKLARAAQPG